ncbi:MAG: hypothetical protein AAB316_02740, partial [Bacteroidota bacterium]
MRELHNWHSLTFRPALFALIFKRLEPQFLKISTTWLLVLFASATWAGNPHPSSLIPHPCKNGACDNVINGGLVEGDEFGCPSPTWNPSPITNVELPTGGTGNLEYIWIYTTMDPTLPNTLWLPSPTPTALISTPGPFPS